jgi:peptidoglycan/xylan/chitin deacetylase (PgdA/CDA1 family)
MQDRIKLMRRAMIALAMVATASQGAAQTACPGNPKALGVARTVAIDTAGGPGFGFEHFKDHDFLRKDEIVLTFDDGPWPHNTAAILAALAAHCTKATFFPIGKHSTWHPEILRSVAEQGHSIGSHTWSHVDLSKLSADKAKAEIEMGISGVRRAIGDAAMPFFRFPALKHPPEMVKYSGERNLGIFSTDVDSFDFKLRAPDKLVSAVMERLHKNGGKGILLMHDFQQVTAKAIPMLLNELQAKGYKVVHMTAKTRVKSLPEYDEMVAAQIKGPVSANARPTSSVVSTVEPTPAPAAKPATTPAAATKPATK